MTIWVYLVAMWLNQSRDMTVYVCDIIGFFRVIIYSRYMTGLDSIWLKILLCIHSLFFIKSKYHKILLLHIYNYKYFICKN